MPDKVACSSLSSILFFFKKQTFFFFKFFLWVCTRNLQCEKYTSENEAINLVLGGAAWSQTQINKTLLSSSFGLTSAPSVQKRLAELGHGDQTPSPSPVPPPGHVGGRHIWSSWCHSGSLWLQAGRMWRWGGPFLFPAGVGCQTSGDKQGWQWHWPLGSEMVEWVGASGDSEWNFKGSDPAPSSHKAT